MKYVALLRGIGPANPNMHPKKLAGVLEDLGFKNVQGVISSGNVIFESRSKNIPALESKIEKAWPRQLGFRSVTIVRSQEDLEHMVASDPFDGLEHSAKSYLLVTFFKQPPKTDFAFPYQPPGKGYTLLGVQGDTLFSVVDTTGTKAPNLMIWLEQRFGKNITSRTWKTVLRILAKMN